MRIFLLFLLSTLISLSYADNTTTKPSNNAIIIKNTDTAKETKPTHVRINSVIGNPIDRRSSYTINSSVAKSATIECVFINTSPDNIKLNVWTDPKSVNPQEVVQLAAGSVTKPIQTSLKLYFKLEKNWWCPVFNSKQPAEKWENCAYLSIADASIKNHNPFAKLEPTSNSKSVSYHCRFQKPNGMSFFYESISGS